MKKIAAKFFLVIIALSYAFVLGLYSVPALADAGSLRAAGKDDLQTASFSAGNMHAVITAQRVHLTPAENSTDLKNNIPGFETSATHLLSAVTVSQHQYLQLSKTLSTSLPGTKLIFPFHYFW